MTAVPSIDPARFLDEQLSQASPDLMRELLTTFVNALLSAQADAVCGAGYNERSPERVNSRNGYRHRDLDTRVGTLDVSRGRPPPRQGDGVGDDLEASRGPRRPGRGSRRCTASRASKVAAVVWISIRSASAAASSCGRTTARRARPCPVPGRALT